MNISNTSMLSGLNILITRPQPQNDTLCQLIAAKGGVAFGLPLLRIEPLSDCSDFHLENNHYSAVIFVSRPAAFLGGKLVKPVDTDVYAMGAGTAQELEKQGIFSRFSSTANSEVLLESKGLLSVKGQRILIIKGKGGRALLKDVLETRGARVDALDLYQRKSLFYSDNHINNTVLTHRINVIVVTSGQILDCLLKQTDKSLLREVTLIVPGARVMEMARERGIPCVICATGADNNAILKSLAMLQKEQGASIKAL